MMRHWFLAIATVAAYVSTACAAGLPLRGGVPDTEIRRLEIAYADLKFAIEGLTVRPTGTGVSVVVSDRPLPSDIAKVAHASDVAWATAVSRAAAALELLTGKEAPRDMVAQNFDRHFAISVPAYGQVVGDNPDQVLGSLAAMMADSTFGRTGIPGVDWQSQIGIMERISLAIVARGGQGFN